MLTKRRRPDGTVTRTIANELYRLERILSYFGYNASLKHTAKWAAIAEFNHWLLRQMTPESANRLLSLLRALLNKAYEWGELEVPPYVRLNRTKPLKNRYLTLDEEVRLIEACPPLLRDFVVFMLDSGARLNEALSLTWRDVDLARKPRSVVHFTKTKNGEIRSVPLPRRGASVLRRLRRTAGGIDSLVFSEPARKTIYTKYSELYCRRGERIPISNYQLLWRRARRDAGLTDVRMHDLRHTYAAKLVRGRVPLIEVARLLGHRQIEMTMRYAHLAVDDLDAAVAVLDRPSARADRLSSERRRRRQPKAVLYH